MRYRLFVIVGRKRGGEPQAKAPGGRQGRLASQLRVMLQHPFHALTTNDIVVKLFTRYAELHLLHVFRGDLEGDLFGMIDKHAIVLQCHLDRSTHGPMASQAASSQKRAEWQRASGAAPSCNWDCSTRGHYKFCSWCRKISISPLPAARFLRGNTGCACAIVAGIWFWSKLGGGGRHSRL